MHDSVMVIVNNDYTHTDNSGQLGIRILSQSHTKENKVWHIILIHRGLIQVVCLFKTLGLQKGNGNKFTLIMVFISQPTPICKT